MTLLYAVLLAALAVILAPVTVKVIDRKAGYPLAGLFLIAAVLIAKEFPAIAAGEELSFHATWVRDFIAPGVDVSFALRGDALSIFFAMLALVIGAVVSPIRRPICPRMRATPAFIP